MREEQFFEPVYEDRSTGQSIIKVIGVGGGGGNAVEHMYSEGIVGVDFLICNTDRQALEQNQVPAKLVLGDSGLGAGADPEVAKNYALSCKDKIAEFIGDHTRMLFITAGMGKGTGTGAAPVIAEIAQEMNILTIGVVTFPFNFEGEERAKYAENGIAKLKDHVDALIVIQNQKIFKFFRNDSMLKAFGYANDVLKNAVKCIAEVITKNGLINVDFNDVVKVLKNSGPAMLGLATASGENRVETVVEAAMTCPLLEEDRIAGARNVLFFLTGGEEIGSSEFENLTTKLREYISKDVGLIFGMAIDPSMGDAIQLALIVSNYDMPQKPKEIVFDPHEKENENTRNGQGQENNNSLEENSVVITETEKDTTAREIIINQEKINNESPTTSPINPDETIIRGLPNDVNTFGTTPAPYNEPEPVKKKIGVFNDSEQKNTDEIFSCVVSHNHTEDDMFSDDARFKEHTSIPTILRMQNSNNRIEVLTAPNDFIFETGNNDINSLFKVNPD
ncbi:MAG: cell division protein FtsZ [Bacteroidales bacterium]|jgi:cell division protein FtsZ|nr:cell division protein FtsZ [Bacteroidales bacterium]